MASRIVGRAECPECGFDAAHVKESEKCIYRYCPECGSQYMAKSDAQRANLLKKTRPNEPVAHASASAATGNPPSATPTPAPPPPAAAAKRHGLGLFQ